MQTVGFTYISIARSQKTLVVGPAYAEGGAGVGLKLIHQYSTLHVKEIHTPILSSYAFLS
jgi:hypothetical protein